MMVSRPIPGLSQHALESFLAKASRTAGLEGRAGVLLTTSRQMRVLNVRFRGKHQATDVLSFPPPGFADGFAGDIAVSVDIAARNARALGHSLADEVRILVLHGVLHLAGYDHESDHGEMAEREAQLRRRLGLPPALTERVSSPRRDRRRTARLGT
jgi:probable rRNA maturation factor